MAGLGYMDCMAGLGYMALQGVTQWRSSGADDLYELD